MASALTWRASKQRWFVALAKLLSDALKASSPHFPLASSYSPLPLALTPTIHHTMMNYHDAVPADLPAFSHWPDALAVGKEMATWTHPAGYGQPDVDGEGIPLDILDSVLAWGQSGRSCIEVPMTETEFVRIFAFGMGENLRLS